MLDNSVGSWSEYYTNGIEATWAKHIKKGDFYLRYVGKVPKLKLINRKLNRLYGSKFQKLIWKVKSFLGWKRDYKSNQISDSKIEIQINETWPNLTAKTINAINFTLLNYDFDFIIRGNSSLYLIPEQLESFLESCKGQLHYAGPVSGEKEFVAGWCIILSRKAAQIIVEDFRKNDSLYFDDEAIGLIMARNNIPIKPLPFEIFDHMPTSNEVNEVLSRAKWILRFKNDSAGNRISVSAMNFVHTMQRKSGELS